MIQNDIADYGQHRTGPLSYQGCIVEGGIGAETSQAAHVYAYASSMLAITPRGILAPYIA